MSDTISGTSVTLDTVRTTKLDDTGAEESAPIGIHIKCMSGEMISLLMGASDHVGTIKKRISKMYSQFKVKQQVLAVMHSDGTHEILTDSDPISSCAYISDGSMLSMMIKDGFYGGEFLRHACAPPSCSDSDSLVACTENQSHAASQPNLQQPRQPWPCGIGISPNGDVLYITDIANRCIDVHSTINGTRICEFGMELGLSFPNAVCVSADGELLFVADSIKDRILVLNALDGSLERTIGYRFFTPAQVAAVAADPAYRARAHRLSDPVGVCISRTRPADDNCNGAADERLYVADAGKHCIQVFRIADGKHMLKIGKRGSGTGQFESPNGICISANGELLFVTDRCNHRVQVFTAASGEHVHTIGSRGAGEGEFEKPCGICVSSCGEWLLVADKGNSRIQVFSAATFEIAHSITAASFPRVDELSGAPHIGVHGMCASPCADAFFVTDFRNHRVLVFSSK